MVMDAAPVPVPLEAVKVTEVAPAAVVGVPEIWHVVGDTLRPAGKVPKVTEHEVIGPAEEMGVCDAALPTVSETDEGL
jgi:hypothetical protein